MQNDEHKPDHPAKPMKEIAHDALHDLTHFDSNLLRTLPVLIFKPGKLSVSAITGKQTEYVKPFALFVFLNFVFFIVKGKGLFHYTLNSYEGLFDERIKEACNELHISVALLAERFNTAMHFEQKEYLVIMVPLFALILQLLFITQRRHYAQQLVFSLHFYAFFIVFLIFVRPIFVVLGWVLRHTLGNSQIIETELFLTILASGVIFSYLLIAIRRFYQQKWFPTIIKSVLLTASVFLLVGYVFRPFLFFVVMHTLME